MYVVLREVRMPWQGRELLVVIGVGHFDTSCCGVGGCGFADVPGFVVGWHVSEDESEVEPVTDPDERATITHAIKEKEKVLEIRFGD